MSQPGRKRSSDSGAGGGGAVPAKRVKQAHQRHKAAASAPVAAAPQPAVPPPVVPPAPHAGKAQGVGANWSRLKQVIGADGGGRRSSQPDAADLERRPRPQSGDRRRVRLAGAAALLALACVVLCGILTHVVCSLTRVLALDCEMVGVGPEGSKSALARVVVVNSAGNAVLDTHVQPHQEVVDYRTAVSGVRPHHLVGAPSLSEVQATVAGLLHGRLVVGHALKNDLKALMLSHPRRLLRDTARYPPLMRKAPHVGGPTAEARRGRPARLQELAAQHLGLTIQTGEHSPVEDARAALLLYQKFATDWEQSLRRGPGRMRKAQHGGGGDEDAPDAQGGHAGGEDGTPHGDPALSQALWKQRRRAQHDRRGEGPVGGKLGAAAGAQRGHAPGGWSALLQRAASR